MRTVFILVVFKNRKGLARESMFVEDFGLKESGKMIKNMKDMKSVLLGFIVVNSKMGSGVVKGSLSGKMERNTKGSGELGISMGLVYGSQVKGTAISGNGVTGR